MKRIVIALVLALTLGCVAFAEETVPTEPAPAVEAAPATNPASVVEEDEPVQEDNDQIALEEALEAYRTAKQDKAVSDLEEELAGYVDAGSLTQEQADLILNSVKEKLAAKNGECPNCGYKFHNARMMGSCRLQRSQSGAKRQGGCRMQGGCQQNGKQRQQQMPDRQRPDAQSGATPQNGQQGNHKMQGGRQMPQNGQQTPDAQYGLTPQNGKTPQR